MSKVRNPWVLAEAMLVATPALKEAGAGGGPPVSPLPPKPKRTAAPGNFSNALKAIDNGEQSKIGTLPNGALDALHTLARSLDADSVQDILIVASWKKFLEALSSVEHA
jgi:hypothetical protein